MVVTKQEVRALGFLKIKSAFSADDGESALSEAITRAVFALGGIKFSPYSMLNYWDSVEDLPKNQAGGICFLMKSAEPLLGEIKPDASAKRKFRHSWDYIWAKFGEACDIDSGVILMLKTLGCVLPLFLSAIELEDETAIKVVKDTSAYKAVMTPVRTGKRSSSQKFIRKADVDILCSFFNSVIYWDYVIDEFVGDYESLVKVLVTTDADSFSRYLLQEVCK